MGTQNEEITIKFGAETGTLESALRKLRRALHDTGEEGHKSFVHQSNGAKQFHHVIHELTAQAPLLGGALQLAISPIAGVFVAVGIAAAKLHEWFGELAKDAKEFSEWAAKPTDKIEHNVRNAAKAVAEVRREFGKWLDGLTESKAEQITEGLHDSLALLEKKTQQAKEADPQNAAKIDNAKLQVQFLMQRDALKKLGTEQMAQAKVVDDYKSKLEKSAAAEAMKTRDNKAEEELQERLKKHIKEESESSDSPLGQIGEGIQKLGIGGSIKAAFKTFFGIAPSEAELKKLEDPALNAQLKASETRVKANNEALDKETEARKTIADELGRAQQTMQKTRSAQTGVSKSLEATRLALSGTGLATDNRLSTQRSADEAVTALQLKTSNWLTGQQQKISEWNIAHGVGPMVKDVLGVAQKPQAKVSIEQALQHMDENIDLLLKAAQTGGIIVKAKD